MTSSVHELSDKSGSNKEPQHSDSEIQPSACSGGMSPPVVTNPAIPYVPPPQLGTAHPLAPGPYPYPDPYYRSIFAPYDAHAYPPQLGSGAHLQLMGIQQQGVPLPSDAVEEPVFVNAKQYYGILRRRQSRAKLESQNKILKSRKPYMHESRHKHALRRPRGCGGRFLNSKKNEDLQDEVSSGEKNPEASINLNSDKNDVAAAAAAASNGTS